MTAPVPPNTSSPKRLASLRSELLLNIAVVAAAALVLAVASVLLYGITEHGAIWTSVLVAADVCVLVVFVAYQVDRIILRPLRRSMAAAEAIAEGDLARRLPEGDTEEMANLASSVNRMTDRLLEERAHVVRAEKMASIGRLAAGIAHEIGNPLGAINGYTHVLRTGVGGNAGDALAGIERESSRIDRIIRGLLDYARARPATQGLVDLNDASRAVVDLLTSQGVLKYVEMQLSPAAEPALVAGERHDVEQVFVNLLLNAVDAMDGRGRISFLIRRTTRAELRSGGRRKSDSGAQPVHPPSARVTRWLDSGTEDDVAVVAIVDSGPGIPPEDVERIFEPFFTTKAPGKGTGLGLAIVARAVENCGGTIWVSASREGGAAFRILLPVANPATRVSTPRAAVTPQPAIR